MYVLCISKVLTGLRSIYGLKCVGSNRYTARLSWRLCVGILGENLLACFLKMSVITCIYRRASCCGIFLAAGGDFSRVAAFFNWAIIVHMSILDDRELISF